MLIGLIVIGVWLWAPRERVALFWRTDSGRFTVDKPLEDLTTADLRALREQIAEQEAEYPDVTDGAEKAIRFSAESRPKRTPYVVLYIHGFSATRQEISPIPETIAQNLHANYYATRLTGHGLDGEALAAATPSDWIFDVMEAWQVARQLGDQVIVIATSTGATLATWLAQQHQVQPYLAALLMVSPNFQPGHWATPMFLWPLARRWLPRLSGPTYGWEPSNDLGAKYWTYRYPVSAVYGMAALVKAVRNSNLEAITAPTLFIYSDDDQVVSALYTDRAMKRWGADIKHRIAVAAKPNDNNHVIAGDIVRPEATEQRLADMMSFLKTNVIS
ncbi:hypothetical protein MED297_02582 [Reinekea sp. MED297]|uniref:AB hydrolase-1 domain-containing protein n=1 Tax=Reinekea blandensis MED297 TaxID=314283 RepID=A4BEP3_9GAMM|nr:hypothetical protein MED297_02582 [Reinekea sp. MED297] [Reinekea blandensis MED297]